MRRVAIKVCTPIAAGRERLGRHPLCPRASKAALEALGYDVRIDKREEWHLPGSPAEVAIHLHGIWQYRPAPGTASILWIISHPEEIDAEFLSAYDTVFCASDAIAARVRALAPGARVATLPQCTDTTVFFPDAAINRDIDIAFVGNSRRIYRDAVRFAVEEGFDVAIWGTRWESFVDRRFIRGTQPDEPRGRRRLPALQGGAQRPLGGPAPRGAGQQPRVRRPRLRHDRAVGRQSRPCRRPRRRRCRPSPTGRASPPPYAACSPTRGATERAAALGAEVRRSHTFAERAAVIAAAIAAIGKAPA